jgi:hypothetical protein
MNHELRNTAAHFTPRRERSSSFDALAGAMTSPIPALSDRRHDLVRADARTGDVKAAQLYH